MIPVVKFCQNPKKYKIRREYSVANFPRFWKIFLNLEKFPPLLPPQLDFAFFKRFKQPVFQHVA
jgi:hypothetical protein